MNKSDLIQYIKMLFDELQYAYADGCGIKYFSRTFEDSEYKLIDALLNDTCDYLVKMLNAKLPETFELRKEQYEEMAREVADGMRHVAALENGEDWEDGE